MNVLYLLVPLALILAGAGVAAFYWSVRSGQYDDTDTPALRVLMEEDAAATAGGDESEANASPDAERE